MWNDSFADEVQLVQGPSHATTFHLNADGSFSYTAEATYNGNDTFTYRAINTYTGLVSTPATVTIHVYIEANSDIYNIGSGSSAWSFPAPGLLSNDQGADSAKLATGFQASHGTVSVHTDGSFTYTPNAGFSGEDSFRYVAYNSGTLEESSPTLVTLHVTTSAPTAVHDDFVAHAQSGSQTVTGNLLANDLLANAVQLVSGSAHGTLTVNTDGTFTYVAEAGFAGSDYFVYRAVNAGTGQQSATTTVYLSFPQVETNPDVYATKVNTTLVVGAHSWLPPGILGVLYNDRWTQSAQSISPPSHGGVAFQADGGFTYSPVAGYVGMDSFQYRAIDYSSGELSAPTTVTIWVLPMQPQGQANYEFTGAVGGDFQSPAGMLTNDSWANAIISLLGTGTVHGTSLGGSGTDTGTDQFGNWKVQYSAFDSIYGSFGYHPTDLGYLGDDSFQYVVVNTNTGQSALRVVMVHIVAPIANDDTFGYSAGTTGDVYGCVFINDNYIHEGENHTRFEIVTPLAHGSMYSQDDELGNFQFRPDEGFQGVDTFQYRAVTPVPGPYGTTYIQSNTAMVTLFIGYDPLKLSGPAKASAEPWLVMSQLLSISDEAVRRWAAAGASQSILEAGLSGVQFVIADLPGSHIGGTTADGRVLIDINAAGYGWFIDTTPGGDTEFQTQISASERRATSTSAAFGRADLLSVVMHELGHVLGLDHSLDQQNVMAETIDLGVRHLPTAADASLVDQFFATRGRRHQ